MRTATAFLIALCALAMGCAPAQMQVPQALSDVFPYPVQGSNPRFWNSPIAFGPWQTLDANSGYTWNFGHRLLGITAEYTHRPYRFALQLRQGPGLAECLTRAVTLSRNDLQVDPGYGNIPVLRCGFGGAVEGTLRLVAAGVNSEKGEIQFGQNRYGVRAVKSFTGSPLQSVDAIGYEIVDGAVPVAAVETINQGRVWISPSLAQADQDQLALAATALLMYRPMDDIEDELDSAPE